MRSFIWEIFQRRPGLASVSVTVTRSLLLPIKDDWKLATSFHMVRLNGVNTVAQAGCDVTALFNNCTRMEENRLSGPADVRRPAWIHFIWVIKYLNITEKMRPVCGRSPSEGSSASILSSPYIPDPLWPSSGPPAWQFHPITDTFTILSQSMPNSSLTFSPKQAACPPKEMISIGLHDRNI